MLPRRATLICLLRRVRDLVDQQRLAGHHHAGDAEAALHGADLAEGVDERLLLFDTLRPSTVTISRPTAFFVVSDAGLDGPAVDRCMVQVPQAPSLQPSLTDW